MLKRLALLLFVFSTGVHAQSLETAVKATYLYKLASFVDWPRGSFSRSDSPINICIVGDDPFGSTIDRAVAGQMVGRHPIRVRRLRQPSRDCHIAYSTDAELLTPLNGTPVLTITDNAAMPKGIINFIIVNDRVRFEINNFAATRNQIGLSSKLLALAR